MAAEVTDTLHFVLLVHRGVRQERRARAAADWYINALDVVDMEFEFFQDSSLRRTKINHAYFLRIGPPKRGIILEVRDSFNNQGYTIIGFSLSFFCLYLFSRFLYYSD
jgi:hypothetical protein